MNAPGIRGRSLADDVAHEVSQLKADLAGLGAKVETMNSRVESKLDGLHADFDALRSKVRANQHAALVAALQNAVLRGDRNPSAKLASCANESPVLKINFVLPRSNLT